MKKLFNPASIAVIGASEIPGKAAERRTRSLLEGNYQGQVFLINPKRKELFGRRCFDSILDVEGNIELVIIIVPPRFVLSAVIESIRKGAKAIIIITAGLGETGDSGKNVEQKILRESSVNGSIVVGPNCSGMFCGSAGINMLGIPGIEQGGISVIAQSGNVIDSLTQYAKKRKLGFSKIISLGNAIGAELHEYLQYLAEDPETKVIISYLESIKNGHAFIQAARETSLVKPLIILKAGRFGAGIRATASHTGALAADDLIVDAAFRQAGIIRVANIDEMFDLAEIFCNSPVPKGKRVAILSEGGGDNSISADNAEFYGIEVPVLSEQTQNQILPHLLEGMPASNPVDYGGTAEENPEVVSRCTEACMKSDEVDAVYITGFFGGFREIIAEHVGELEERAARELAEQVKQYDKPLFMHSSFAGEDIPSLEILRTSGIPVMESSDRSMRCLAELMNYGEKRKRKREYSYLETPPIDQERVGKILECVRTEKRRNLLETESQALLQACGMRMPPSKLAKTAEEAIAVAAEFKSPVALKVVSPAILHKSESGGIRLNLNHTDEIQQAFDEIHQNALRVTEPSRIRGVLVSPMARPGQECILGMIRDPQFGPVLMFGLGGVFVEVLKDVSFRVTPVRNEDLHSMIREIRGFPLLTGVRGEGPKDIESLKEMLAILSILVDTYPEIEEIDLNPVIVHENGASAVDSRILLSTIREPISPDEIY